MAKSRRFGFRFKLAGGLTVTEAEVSIYRIGKKKPRRLDRRIVESSRFEVNLPVSRSSFYYAVAEIRSCQQDGVEIDLSERILQLVSVFDRSSRRIAFSERVTVATAYCFSRFTTIGRNQGVGVSDPDKAAALCFGMKRNFVSTKGSISDVISTSPNGLESNSYPMFNSLSNLVFGCIADAKTYAGFMKITSAESLFAGLLNLALDPFAKARELYTLIGKGQEIYRPSLHSLTLPKGTSSVPSQWTLTIKRNDSGSENFMIAGVGYAAFDKNDRVWLANNVRQGTPNSSTFCVILEPDGSPAPFSPLFGGGLLGPGFGVASDPKGKKIYFGNFGWGPAEWNPQTGSVSAFSYKGKILSPSNGYAAGLSRVQGMTCDRQGNLWMASWGSQDPMPPTKSRFNFEGQNSAVTVYLKGNPKKMLTYPMDDMPSPYNLTFDVVVDDDGNAYVSNAGDGGHKVPSSVYKFRIEDGELKKLASWTSDYKHKGKTVKGKTVSKTPGVETFRQVTVSPDGNVYVGAVATSRVIKLDSDLNYLGEFTNKIHDPWGIIFDPEGTLYVSNFAPGGSGMFGVTIIRDDDESTAQFMNLPTGGDQVTLANGLPLYGNPEDSSEAPASYDPLMRLTGSRIDRAGNLWACNNWKPSGKTDVVDGDPGGDGVVIFVGAAAPSPH